VWSPPMTCGNEPRSLTIGGMPLIMASAATRPNGAGYKKHAGLLPCSA
jgi:hypothetical protein